MLSRTAKLVIIITLLRGGIALAEPTWITFGKAGTEGAAPALTVLESGFSGTTINLKTSGMWTEDAKVGEDTYQKITLPSSYTGEVGKPMLPTVNRLVAIPATAGVKVEVTYKEEVVLEDYLVYPAQVPESYSDQESEFEIDDEFYSLDTLYPFESGEAGVPGIMRDIRLVQLRINPFRYNPKTKELTVATDLTIHLDYSDFDERNALERKSSYIAPQWDRLYRGLLLNYDNLYNTARDMTVFPPAGAEQYVIIYADKFEANPSLQEFIEWKSRKGFWVYAVNLDSIIPPAQRGRTENAETLKQWIQTWYNINWGWSTGYCILLVGDAPVFDVNAGLNERRRFDPVKRVTGDSTIPTWYYGWKYDPDNYGYNSWGRYSDYYYQLLSGTDDFADIALGRWSVSNSADLEACVRKTLDYERDIEEDNNWNLDRVLLCAPYAVRQPGEIIPIDGKRLVMDGVLVRFGQDVDSVYGQDPYYMTTAHMVDSLEQDSGVGILNFIGHGDYTWWQRIGWEDPSNFFTSDVRGLENETRCPLAFGLTCRSGNICWSENGTSEVECMTEAWTRYPDGGGTAAFGASYWIGRPSAQTLDSAIFSGFLDHELDCGMAIIYGKACVINAFGQGLDTLEDFNGLECARVEYWIGDPALDMWRHDPHYDAYALFSLSGTIPPILGVHVGYDSTHASPVPGARVCLYRKTGVDYWSVSYTDEFGSAYFPYPDDPEGVLVTITCQKDTCIKPILTSLTEARFVTFETGDKPLGFIEWSLKPLKPGIIKSRASISYSIGGISGSKETEHVEIAIFDASGRKVKTLVSGRESPGRYSVAWNATDNEGRACPYGVYFIRLRSPDFQACERVILLK